MENFTLEKRPFLNRLRIVLDIRLNTVQDEKSGLHLKKSLPKLVGKWWPSRAKSERGQTFFVRPAVTPRSRSRSCWWPWYFYYNYFWHLLGHIKHFYVKRTLYLKTRGPSLRLVRGPILTQNLQNFIGGQQRGQFLIKLYILAWEVSYCPKTRILC